MEKLTLLEIQNIQFEMLKILDGICRRHNIKYSIEGGTLLGAVKFHGFVPWDDDIDIVMKRSEYNKFISCCKTELAGSDFILENYELNQEFPLNYSKLCYKKTKIVDYDYSHLETLSHGVFLDIFPIDYLNTDKGKTFRRRIIGFLTSVRRNKLKVKFPMSKAKQILISCCSFMTLKQITKMLHYWLTKDDKKGGKFIYELCNQNSNFKPLPSSLYEEYIDLQFKDIKVMAIKNYNSLLEDRFGKNFMSELPPEESRVPSHCDRIYWLNDLEK